VEMNGVPQLVVMRSISLYGLSDVRLTFEDDTDNYFARQVAFERLRNVALPTGVTPTLAPLFSPSCLVYRYVLESPDRTPQELKTIEDWVLERAYKSVPGVADDSGFDGTVMQYQVLLDPARLYSYHLTVPQVMQALAANNGNTGAGFYQQGPVLLCARPWGGEGYRRYRQYRPSEQQGHTSARPRYGASHHRTRVRGWGRLVSRGMMMPWKASSSCGAANRRRMS
jgi:cobalt-zinc-cadmium resistance protein CzcA